MIVIYIASKLCSNDLTVIKQEKFYCHKGQLRNVLPHDDVHCFTRAINTSLHLEAVM